MLRNFEILYLVFFLLIFVQTYKLFLICKNNLGILNTGVINFIYNVNIKLTMSEKSVLNKVNFCVVYCENRKKADKYFKINKISKKTVLDIRQIMIEEMEGESDIMFLKILIFNKIQRAINKGRDIYFIPNFDDGFSIKKMLNLKTSNILGANNFNILLFYNDFSDKPEILSEALENLSHFDHTQIIKDY